jgi:tRNA-dihydrouridine synthase A
LPKFIDIVSQAGCETFIIHARKAWLDGLSPKDNREIPPLRYDFVYQLKKDFSHLNIIINGGIKTIKEMKQHLNHVDGVMIGREAYHNCYFMKEVDSLYNIADQNNQLSRKIILSEYMDYAEKQMSKGVPLNHLARHTLGLFHACPGARLYRREISENANKAGAGIGIMEKALSFVDSDN